VVSFFYISSDERQFQSFLEVSNSLKYGHASPRPIPRFEIHVPGPECSGSVVSRDLDGVPAYAAQTKA
jgi:hypothetical protein